MNEDKIEKLRELRVAAQAEEEQERRMLGALAVIVGRLCELVPNAEADPLIRLCAGVIGDEPNAWEKLQAALLVRR